jgi:Na+-driven multidrug efflux pump
MTVVLDLTLIPGHGFVGAAIASSVAYTTTMVVNMWWVVRNSNLTVRTLLVPTRTDVRSLLQYWPVRPR